MAVDWMAELYIDQGWAREISKEEALKILRQNEEDGLILQVENTINPTYFCGCCTCCCGNTAGLKKIYKPHEYMDTNFQAHVNEDACTGCGMCVDRCQMEAIPIVENVSQIKKNRCIGCGICVISCLSHAIELRRKEEEKIPPKDFDDLYSQILEQKIQNKKKKDQKEN
ncbi:MAG: ATP-binding protein [Promethearchaeota archaeon]